MPAQVSTNRLKVLVVDDRRDATLMLQALLKQAGHEVVTAENADIALEIASEFEPDAIISDLGLPGELDGCAFARAICSDVAIPAPRMIAITGHDDDEHRQLAHDAGFQHYFVKPARLDELLALLDELASERRHAANSAPS